MTEEEKTDSANGEANGCNGAQFDTEKSSAAAQAGSEAKAEEAADNPSVYAKLIDSVSAAQALAWKAQSASIGKAFASMAQSIMLPAQEMIAQSIMFPAQEIIDSFFRPTLPKEQAEKIIIEKRRSERVARWAESIRETHANLFDEDGTRVKVTSQHICEMLGWSKNRMANIESHNSDLKVWELFSLADLFKMPPMLLIGETSKQEEALLSMFRELTEEQRASLLDFLGATLRAR